MIRAADLHHFLITLRRAIAGASEPGSPPAVLAERIFKALETPAASAPVSRAPRPPLAGAMDEAFARAARGPVPVQQVAGALRAMDRRLSWGPRPGSENADPVFRDAHANAVIVGDTGLERRSDVLVGVSFLKAHACYVEHRHPPEEVYFVLTAGEWWREGAHWEGRGAGDIVHHLPGVRHNMRAGAAPLLALWCLWTARH